MLNWRSHSDAPHFHLLTRFYPSWNTCSSEMCVVFALCLNTNWYLCVQSCPPLCPPSDFLFICKDCSGVSILCDPHTSPFSLPMSGARLLCVSTTYLTHWRRSASITEWINKWIKIFNCPIKEHTVFLEIAWAKSDKLSGGSGWVIFFWVQKEVW